MRLLWIFSFIFVLTRPAGVLDSGTVSNGGGEEAAEETETDWKSGNKNQSQPRGKIQGTETHRLPFHILVTCVCDFGKSPNKFP